MPRLWLYTAFSRVPGYRAKILLAAALGGGGALAALAFLHSPVLALASLALGLAAILFLLEPVRLAAEALRRFAEEGETPVLPVHHRDLAGRLMADVQATAARLHVFRERATQRHPVTGLPTREPFLAEVAADVAAGGPPQLLGTIRFAGYDRLAAFDRDAAERALKAFATRLAGALRKGRLAAHVDRDCFAVWFRGAHGISIATAELQALGQLLAQEIREEDFAITPQVEEGAAAFPADGADAATLLSRAFFALARPEASGRPGFFSAMSAAAARDRFALEQDLRRGLERDQFVLHFQPVVDVVAGRLIGAEALLRWRHPERGLVSPARFVPVLEEAGLIDAIGHWILKSVIREAHGWQEQGLGAIRTSVNLSARQLRDPALTEIILATLRQYGLPPSLLELELTETAAMEDADRTLALFAELHDLGVHLAIDDFGSGYASLSYVKKLPFDKLKIDREFVTDVDKRRDSQAICRALIELARGLDLAVVAEGVETRGEVEMMRALGCAAFQGFFFARPLPAAEFVRTVTNPAWQSLLKSPVHRELAALREKLEH